LKNQSGFGKTVAAQCGKMQVVTTLGQLSAVFIWCYCLTAVKMLYCNDVCLAQSMDISEYV